MGHHQLICPTLCFGRDVQPSSWPLPRSLLGSAPYPSPSSCLLFSFQPQGQQLDLVRVWIQCYHLSMPEFLLSHLRALCPLRNRDSGHMHCTELMSRKMLLSNPGLHPGWLCSLALASAPATSQDGYATLTQGCSSSLLPSL